jgi:hypothetical protein
MSGADGILSEQACSGLVVAWQPPPRNKRKYGARPSAVQSPRFPPLPSVGNPRAPAALVQHSVLSFLPNLLGAPSVGGAPFFAPAAGAAQCNGAT